MWCCWERKAWILTNNSFLTTSGTSCRPLGVIARTFWISMIWVVVINFLKHIYKLLLPTPLEWCFGGLSFQPPWVSRIRKPIHWILFVTPPLHEVLAPPSSLTLSTGSWCYWPSEREKNPTAFEEKEKIQESGGLTFNLCLTQWQHIRIALDFRFASNGQNV